MAGGKMKLSILSYFFISFVLDGLLRLSGLFVLELLQSTDLSHQDAVVPFILSWVVSNIVASFSSILNENKHSEHIILFGILLCATGTALCIFATNITTLIVCWGLLFGSGYGLAYPHLSIRLKSENGDKLSSILQMTPSLGATIMPFVFSILTSYYALQGSFLIFCGIILNYLPLALAAAHDFEISIPNIKWRVRKKSSQYSVSKYEERKSVSDESFINSLEPDLILEINQLNTIQDEDKNQCSVMINPVTEIPPIGRRRSETRGNDLQSLDSRFFNRNNKTPSRLFAEIKEYENDRNIFEENIVADNDTEQRESNKVYDTINNVKALEKKTPNCEDNSDLNLKYQVLDKITEQEIEDSAYENNELEIEEDNEQDCCDTCDSYENNSLISTSALSESEIEQSVNEKNSLTFASKLSQSEIKYNVDESNSFTSPSALVECQIIQNVDESNGLTSTCETSESGIKQNIHESNSLTSPNELMECQIMQNVDEMNGLTSVCGLSESEIKQNIHESNSLTPANELLECQIIQNVDESNSLTSTSELLECQIIQNVDEGNSLTSACGLSRSDTEQNVEENKTGSSFSNTLPLCDQYSSKDQISSQTEQDGNPNYQSDEKSDKASENPQKAKHPKSLNCSSPTKKEIMQSVQKENVLLSPNSLKTKYALNTSMVIKIHVEECTFTDEKQWAKNFNSPKVKPTKDSYIKHSKSVKLDMHEHKLLDNQKISKRLSKCSKLCKSKLSGIYSISENCDHYDKKIYSEKLKKPEKMCSNQINVQRIVKHLEITTSRVWLSILLMSVIFEINLVTLLTMFADLGSDVDNISSDFKWILVAFGVGGFIGKICCCKISRVIPEKYHAIGVVLFLLNGLTTAGILYSSNLNWLAGFYCILGALEGGITYIIPKIIYEYIDEDVHSSLRSVKCFFSGVAIMCIPYGIGLFRDDMGDYEFLLQILSCSSILCAFLAYFLPHLISTSHKQTSAF